MSKINPDHYNKYDIQAIDFMRSLGVSQDFLAGNVIKYVSRYKDKDGRVDLGKALFMLASLILELGGTKDDITHAVDAACSSDERYTTLTKEKSLLKVVKQGEES